MVHVFLSPHLDDAVLSCGGMLSRYRRAGQEEVVVTLCAGRPPAGPLSPLARRLHRRWGLSPDRVVAQRRAEDRAALRRLGIQGLYLPIPDCIYRRHPVTGRWLYRSDRALFGELQPAEQPLVQQCARRLQQRLRRWPVYRLYVPLGLGRHVDHQLARLAAEQTGPVYAYYEDYPYVTGRFGSTARVALTNAAGQACLSQVVRLTGEDMRAKVHAVAAYVSQLGSFWAAAADMSADLWQCARQVGEGAFPAERLWRAPV